MGPPLSVDFDLDAFSHRDAALLSFSSPRSMLITLRTRY